MSLQSRFQQMIRAAFTFAPSAGREAGDHSFDGRIADFSPTTVTARLKSLDDDIQELSSARAEGVQEDIERRALRAHLEAERFNLGQLGQIRRSPLGHLALWDVSYYLKREWAPLETRLSLLAEHLDGFEGAFEGARDSLDQTLSRPELETAMGAISGIAEFFDSEIAPLTESHRDLRRPFERARSTLQLELDLFGQRALTAKDDFALGEPDFLRLLALQEMVESDVDDLQRRFEEDLERNAELARQAAAELLPGASVEQAMQLLEDDHPSADGLLAEASARLASLRSHLESADVVTVPQGGTCEVRPSPSYYAFVTAALDPPGPLEEMTIPSFYYVTVPTPDWGPERTEEWLRYFNRAMLENTGIHEVLPGHFLHFLHLRSVSSYVGKAFWCQSMGEGWAHYCEQLMGEIGYHAWDSRLRLAAAKDALLRDCRSLAAIGMHCQAMNLEAATQLFMERGLMTRVPAEREAKRGAWDPLYLNYTLGKLLILEMRQRAQRQWGSSFSLKRFHDQLLSWGLIPLPLISEAMFGRPASTPAP